MPNFKFSKDIINTCTTEKDSVIYSSPVTVWREDLNRLQRSTIVQAVKKFASTHVFLRKNDIQHLCGRCDSYRRLISVSWSRDYPDQLWATYNVIKIRKDSDGISIYTEQNRSPVDPCGINGEAVEMSAFNKKLKDLFHSISVRLLNKNICF